MKKIIARINNLVDANQKSNEQINFNVIMTIITTILFILTGFILITRIQVSELITTIAMAQIASLMALAVVLKEARKDRENLQERK